MVRLSSSKKPKTLQIFIFIVLAVLFVFSACEKDDTSNSEEDQTLTCGSSLPSRYQCISAAGKSTITSYNIPELIGCWDNDGNDFCIEYKSDGTGIITSKPSTFVTASTATFKWGAMVDSKGKLLLSNVGTIYIAHQATQGSFDPQLALLSFKQSTKQFYGYNMSAIAKCATVSGGGTGTTGTGNIIFWINSDLGCGNITVSVSGKSATINKSFSASPACGADGGANFTLPVGNYSYTAECSGKKWTSTFSITQGVCFKMQLSK
ncbi:hypothetical protein [Pedobacter duraquae]|uniref:Lipoprotein n=1 Tax=Pedobacter duraquae TaxID=425511 RepID=A0A4R6IP94_9SPHI|nr:hypothetical protein [Pedobacter duraquae]TDO24073.1 hypothetical protein CLV32_0360 [Pedobacter duraquae]